jgi:DNA-binding MarR family transcriptional regulator
LSSDLIHRQSQPTSLGPPLIGALLRAPWENVHERMLAGLHERGYSDLVAAHLRVLQYPGPEDMRPSDLAARIGMSRQALNYLLGEMEGLGYLTRVEDRADQRFKRIHLTRRGHAASVAMREIVLELEAEWAQKLGSRRFAELRELLTELNATMSDGMPHETAD